VYLLELGSNGLVSSDRPGVPPRRFRDGVMPVRRGELKYRLTPKSIERGYARGRNTQTAGHRAAMMRMAVHGYDQCMAGDPKSFDGVRKAAQPLLAAHLTEFVPCKC
jgi:hypothetical protein